MATICRKASILFCVILAIALIIMAQPNSTHLTFAPAPDDYRIVPYSYFDFEIIGYAHFFEPITSIVTIVWLIVSISGVVLNKITLGAAIIGVICSIFSLLATFGYGNPDYLSIIISMIIVSTAILQIIIKIIVSKKSY